MSFTTQPTLEERISALEDALGKLGTPPDSIQPNYLVVNPDGTVGANFTGHIHAEGLDLDAGTTTTPPSVDRARWLRTSDGGVVADIYGFSGAGQEAIVLDAYSLLGGDTSYAQLIAWDSSPAPKAFLIVEQTDGGSPTSDVTASASGHAVRLIDSLGRSGLLQLGATQLSAAGTNTVHFPGGSQFSNAKNVKLTGATGTVFLVANAENSLGTGVVIMATPDAAGGSNVQAWSSVAPAASDVTFQYLQWGN